MDAESLGTPQPTPEDVEFHRAFAAIDPKTLSLYEKLERSKSVGWLVDRGLASAELVAEWGETPPDEAPAPNDAPHPLSLGNPRQSAPKPPPKRELLVRDVYDIEPEETEWLFDGRFALGRVHMIVGRQGLGKSTMLGWLAAQTTLGGGFPDTMFRCRPGSALILQAEESDGGDIRPRYEAFGAVRGKCGVIEGVKVGDDGEKAFSLIRDCDLLDAECERRKDVRLIVIDPLRSYLQGISGNNASEVDAMLDPLYKLAKSRNVCVILVSHFAKDQDREIMDRVAMSGALTQRVRMCWYFSEDPSSSERRVLSYVKGNLHAHVKTALSCSYNERKKKLVWSPEPIKLVARQIDSQLQRKSREEREKAFAGRPASEGRKARELICAYLEEKGPSPRGIVYDQAMNLGVSHGTFIRSLRRLVSDDARVEEFKNDRGQTWLRLKAVEAAPPAPESPSAEDVEGVDPPPSEDPS